MKDVDEKWRAQMEERVADTDRRPMVSRPDIHQVNEFFPPDTVFALDGGNTCVWAAHYLKVRAQRSMLWTSNAGHLGTGLPFAIGAKVAAPERTGLLRDRRQRFPLQHAGTGDGGAPQPRDHCHRGRRRGVGHGEKRSAPRLGTRGALVRVGAHAGPVRPGGSRHGCHGEYVDRATDLRPALERSAASGKPSVIHAAVDPVENIDPPGLALWAAARSGAK